MSGETTFAERVLEVVADIPAGRVMTYGDIAAVLGSRGARMVGQVMARYGSDVPWWRVIRAGGLPPVCHEGRALEHYRAEGTPLRWLDGRELNADGAARTGIETRFRVDLRAAGWWPGDPSLLD